MHANDLALLVGSTRHVQAWYRDPDGGGTGCGLSNGPEVAFTPRSARSPRPAGDTGGACAPEVSCRVVDSLLDPSGLARTLERVARLTVDSRPAWGRLTPAGMVVHCQRPLLVAFGVMRIERSFVGRLFGGRAKRKFVTGDAPFPRDLPTERRFIESEPGPFESERGRLAELVRRFAEPGSITVLLHPFFGPMTVPEWDRLMSKHLDHHLRQFGV